MKMIERGILVALMAMLVASCSNGANDEGSCGADGTEVTVDSVDYCVYRQAVVVENGFQCPPDLPHLTQQGGIGVCSERGDIPDRELEQIGERYRDQQPMFEDCIFDRECGEGSVCRDGDCRAASNNTGINNGVGTNNATTNNGTTNNGATNNATCTTATDCGSGQTCDNGDCVDTCGGLSALACDASEWCDYPDDAICGANDALGICRPRPEACLHVVDPVCGCDGVDYGNSCEANSGGVDVASLGTCL